MMIAEDDEEFSSEREKPYKLYAPYEDVPYDTYESLAELKEDLEDIKRLSSDWEDWKVEAPEGRMPAYEL
jgi:hypothetical protein